MTQYRKVIALGRSTFCLTLPKEWVTRHRIAKGSTVFVSDQQPGTLIVSVNEQESLLQEKPREITITVDGKDDESIQREVVAAYVQDYTDITLIGEIEPRLEHIKRILQDLLALEIMSVTKSKIIAKVFLDTTHASLENVLKRLDMINRTIFEQTRLILDNKKAELEFEPLHEIDRLSYVALRSITRGLNNPTFAKQLGMSVLELLFFWQVIDRIKKIADRVSSIFTYFHQNKGLQKLPKEIRDETQQFFLTLETHYRDVIMSYYKRDRATSNDLIRQLSNYRIEVAKFFAKENKDLAHFAELARRASAIIEDIAIITLERL